MSRPIPAGAVWSFRCRLRDKEEIDAKTAMARREGVLRKEPEQSGEPVGYYVFFSDPDGNTLELSYGQRVGLEVLRSEK